MICGAGLQEWKCESGETDGGGALLPCDAHQLHCEIPQLPPHHYHHCRLHLLSVLSPLQVTGELLDNLTCWDALRAALPVGTVSGAPKVKAMELIDKFEPTRRGPYSGGMGYVSFTGEMDIALALRTMVFPTFARYDTMYSYDNGNDDGQHRREWVVHLQAGAGLVADSNPTSEFQETVNKAAGLARAIDLAESAFLNRKKTHNS